MLPNFSHTGTTVFAEKGLGFFSGTGSIRGSKATFCPLVKFTGHSHSYDDNESVLHIIAWSNEKYSASTFLSRTVTSLNYARWIDR